jgi:hypothetical protein
VCLCVRPVAPRAVLSDPGPFYPTPARPGPARPGPAFLMQTDFLACLVRMLRPSHTAAVPGGDGAATAGGATGGASSSALSSVSARGKALLLLSLLGALSPSSLLQVRQPAHQPARQRAS